MARATPAIRSEIGFIFTCRYQSSKSSFFQVHKNGRVFGWMDGLGKADYGEVAYSSETDLRSFFLNELWDLLARMRSLAPRLRPRF